MERLAARVLIICLLIGACLALTIPLSAQEEFRARLITLGGPTREKMVSVKISIEDFSTKDEVLKLQRILYESGSSGFLNAFRKANKGTIRFIGARGLNLRINAAQSRPTENGRKILLFTERQSWDTEADIRLSGKYLFMVVELDVDEDGKGTGKFYKAANIEMTSKGTIDIESYQPPMMLRGVRKTK